MSYWRLLALGATVPVVTAIGLLLFFRAANSGGRASGED